MSVRRSDLTPEIARIVQQLEESFSGPAYHGPAILSALKGVSASNCTQKPGGSLHSICELVVHVAAELRHACALLEGTAVQWVEGVTTWPPAPLSWPEAMNELSAAHESFLAAVARLHDDLLDTELTQVRRTYYVMLHGMVQHNAYHAGQISLLKRMNK